ncbi:MAG: CorA family divalent cation transporter [Chlamydiota bacterium]
MRKFLAFPPKDFYEVKKVEKQLQIFYKPSKEGAYRSIETPKEGVWIHVDDAKASDLDRIMELTDIDYTHLKDSLDRYEVPRIEQEDTSILVFTRHPCKEEGGLYTESLTIILTREFFITISPKKSELIDSILKNPLRISTLQRSKLLFHILLRITQHFNTSIKMVRHQVLEQEKNTDNIDSESIVDLTKNEEILNQYLTSLVPMKNLLEAISSGRFVHLYEKDIDLLQDLTIAIKQSEDLCSVNIKSIRSLRDAYQIIFTNDVNKTIKRLTAITIIFTIPTIISSVYGMNISLPLEKNPLAFIILLNVILVTSFLSVLIFLRKKWL